jgi:hypothetical protein
MGFALELGVECEEPLELIDDFIRTLDVASVHVTDNDWAVGDRVLKHALAVRYEVVEILCYQVAVTACVVEV